MPRPLSSDLDVIKKPYSKTDWDESNLLDLMQCMDDPLFFMRTFMKVQHPTKGAIPFEPYEYQKRMIAGMHEHRFCILMTARQLGKALALDTPIPTPSGWTTMGNLKVGDIIFGADGRETKVIFATEVMENHDCYAVQFDNAETIIADADHLWEVDYSLYGHKRITDVLTTAQLVSIVNTAHRNAQSVRIKCASALHTKEATLPVPPYTLGVWLGDGNSSDARFYGHEDDCSEMRMNVSKDGFGLSDVKYDSRNSDVAYQTIYGLRGRLVEAGVFKNKHIPDIYLRASINQRLELLRGLMDTDGYADKNGGCEFYQKDKTFILQVFELLASLGIKPRLRSKLINGEVYYTLRFATVDFEVFKLKRKQEIISQNTKGHIKNKHIYIKSITKTESVPVRCIQVDNDSHLFLCGRSMIPTHNTTCAAGYLLWYAMFVPDSTILVVANKFSQAMEIMERIRYAYENLPNHIRAGVTEYNKSNISFDNGSRIVARATSPDAGRGLAVSLLYADEFAFVPPNKQKEFWTSIQPTLSTGGSCIITSTPKNDEDEFAQLWRGAEDKYDEFGNLRFSNGVGTNDFFSVKVTWHEHPERTDEWARGFRASLGEARFRQEFECDFVTDDETLINPLTLNRLQAAAPKFFIGSSRWYHEPEPNKTYLVALDPSLGTHNDYAAIQVFQMPEMIQVAEWQINDMASRHQVRALMEILYSLDSMLREHPDQVSDPEIFWSFENNTIGEGVLTIIEDTNEERFPGMLVTEPRRKGIQMKRVRRGLNTTPRNKLSACARLKSLIESGRMKVNSANLLKELKNFVAVGQTFKAKSGMHDDLVLATLMVVRMLDIVLRWGTEGGDLREYIEDDELLNENEPMPVLV